MTHTIEYENAVLNPSTHTHVIIQFNVGTRTHIYKHKSNYINGNRYNA